MYRYCLNCKKDYDFSPLEVSGQGNLICPACGEIIDKNSRNPGRKVDTENTESAIGNAFAGLLHYSYIFYLVVATIGVISFVLGLYKVLYITTSVIMVVFAIQMLSRVIAFSGMMLILLPVMIVPGYILWNIPGACLGVNVAFILRHLIRDIVYRFVKWLISL